MPFCPDCRKTLFCNDYGYAMHRAFKHDDWTLLDAWYKKRGKPNPYK